MAVLRVKDNDGNLIEIHAIEGKTPIKGTDYWTEADKAEMVNDVLEALPTWEGGTY